MSRFVRALGVPAEGGFRLGGYTCRLNRVVSGHHFFPESWRAHSFLAIESPSAQIEGSLVAVATLLALVSAFSVSPCSAEERGPDTPAVSNQHTAKFKIFSEKARRCTYEVSLLSDWLCCKLKLYKGMQFGGRRVFLSSALATQSMLQQENRIQKANVSTCGSRNAIKMQKGGGHVPEKRLSQVLASLTPIRRSLPTVWQKCTDELGGQPLPRQRRTIVKVCTSQKESLEPKM